MTDSEHKPSVLPLKRFTQALAPRHEPETDEADEAFKQARAKSRESLMLDVRLADGTIVSFPYMHLSRAKYLPDGSIVLRFGKDEVIAEGKNLIRLRDLITEHRARFIQEGTEVDRGLKAEDAAHIDRIVIHEGDEEL
jgi:hypothetical protein